MGYFVLCFVGGYVLQFGETGHVRMLHYYYYYYHFVCLVHDIHADAVSFRPVPILNSACEIYKYWAESL